MSTASPSSPRPEPQAAQPSAAPGSAQASARAFTEQAGRASAAAGQKPGGSGGPGLAEQAVGTAGKVVSAAMAPVGAAARVLPAKGGLPLYAGLGGLALVGVIEWPVAVAAGAGYGLARLLQRPEAPQPPAGNGGSVQPPRAGYTGTAQHQPAGDEETGQHEPARNTGPTQPAS